jgi:alkylmercury lyase
MAELPITTSQISEQVACSSERLDDTDCRLQAALLRLLADGQPTEPARLAQRAGQATADVLARLGGWHGVQTDDEGRIVAFRGLTVVETPHRLRVGGRTLYAWCAWDTLFLPELIGRAAEIESTCPATGQAISLRVGPEGPSDVSPATAVLSFILPGSAQGDDSIESFCRFIHFFASAEAADEWTRQYPGTFVISVEQGFEIGRRTNAAVLR